MSRDPIGAASAARRPLRVVSIDGRMCEVWGKPVPEILTGWHDLCWTVTASPLSGEASRMRTGFVYPHAVVMPIQPVFGWTGVRTGLGHPIPYAEGFFVRAGDSECKVYGFSRTPEGAWQTAAEALHAEIAHQPRRSL